MWLSASGISGSVLPEWWLSNPGLVAQMEPEYSNKVVLLNAPLYSSADKGHFQPLGIASMAASLRENGNLKKKKPPHFAVREETEFDLIQKINENQ